MRFGHACGRDRHVSQFATLSGGVLNEIVSLRSCNVSCLPLAQYTRRVFVAGRLALVLIVAACSGASSDQKTVQAEPHPPATPTPTTHVLPQEPDYQAILQREWVQEPDFSRFSLDSGWKLDRYLTSDPRRVAYRAHEAWEAYEFTGDVRFARASMALVQQLGHLWANDPAKIPWRCFFTQAPLLAAYGGLAKEATIDPLTIQGIEDFSKRVAIRQLGTDNQALSRQVGVAAALRLFPDSPEAPKWKAYLDDGWADLYSLQDLDENATGYCAIGLRAAITLARASNRLDKLKTPKFRSVFERYRDLLSPAGSLPEWGDNYFSPDINADWLFVFENAARIFDDPTFLTAAWKLFWRGAGDPPSFCRADTEAFGRFGGPNIAWIRALGPAPFAPEPIPAASLVTRRRTPRGEVPDKMVIAPDRLPGSPFVLFDLYCDGFHAHQNRLGAILYYEAGGIPFFHGLTRHATGAEHSNQVILRPADEPFPDGTPLQENKWRTATFPARLAGEPDPSAKGRRTLSEITFRAEGVRGNLPEIIIDKLRLEGRGGIKVLQSFELPQPGFEQVEDSTDGEHSAQIPAGSKKTLHKLHLPTPAEWDPKEFSSLSFDWKFRGPPLGKSSFLFRVPGLLNAPTAFLNAWADLRDFNTKQQGRDSYGVLDLADYQADGVTLKREVLVLAEGPVIIRDTLTSAAEASGFRAGPLWHLYSLSDKGEGWFASNDGEQSWPYPNFETPPFPRKNLLVWYAPAEGREIGLASREIVGNMTHTTFAAQALAPGTHVRFLTVLVPFPAGDKAATWASGITTRDEAGKNTLAIPLDGGLANISWDFSGAFSIQRNPSTKQP